MTLCLLHVGELVHGREQEPARAARDVLQHEHVRAERHRIGLHAQLMAADHHARR